MRWAALLGLVGMLLGTTGCFKVKQEFHVLPDGSGKVIVSWAMAPMLAAMMSAQGEGQQEDPTQEFRKLEGVVWQEPAEEVGEDGWKYTTLTGFFRDINAVKSGQFEGGIEFAPSGDGHKLVLRGKGDEEGSETPEGGPGEGEVDPQMEAMVKQMMAGLEVSVQFFMPGAITEMTEFPYFAKRSDRSAGVLITDKDLMEGDLEENQKKLEIDEVTIQSGPADEAALTELRAEVAKGLQTVE